MAYIYGAVVPACQPMLLDGPVRQRFAISQLYALSQTMNWASDTDKFFRSTNVHTYFEISNCTLTLLKKII
jgi:hypothetical protein